MQKTSFFKVKKDPRNKKCHLLDTESILTSKETLFIIQDIRHVHHLAPTLFVLHLQTDEILILLYEVAVLVLILNILRRVFSNSSFMQQRAK